MLAKPAAALEGDPVKSAGCMNCTECHANDGAGGIRTCELLSADVRWSALAPVFAGDALIRQALLFGVDGRGDQLGAEMPRFRGRLIDAEIDNIVAFLQTLAAPTRNHTPVFGALLLVPPGRW